MVTSLAADEKVQCHMEESVGISHPRMSDWHYLKSETQVAHHPGVSCVVGTLNLRQDLGH